MIAFFLSQLIGIATFFVLNFSIYCYLRNQKSKQESELNQKLIYKYGYQIIVLFLCSGLTYRALVIKKQANINLQKWVIEYEDLIENVSKVKNKITAEKLI